MIGTTSSPQTVTLTNTGYLTLKIVSVSVTGAEATDFNQTHSCGSNLPAAVSCTISIRFKPTKIGPRTASVIIADNGVGSPQSIALSGTGVVSGPNATLSSTSLTFVPQILGTSSPTQSVRLSNYGTMTLSITSIGASGDFSQNNTCGSSLAAGAGCTIGVTFKPTQQGQRTGTLSITDNARGSPQNIALSGIGATATTVTLTPGNMGFSCVARLVGGGCTPPQIATLTNTGASTLYVLRISINGLYFSQTNNCPSTLGHGHSCAITVSFDGPASRSQPQKKMFAGSLFVYDTATQSPQEVSLTGTTFGVP